MREFLEIMTILVQNSSRVYVGASIVIASKPFVNELPLTLDEDIAVSLSAPTKSNILGTDKRLHSTWSGERVSLYKMIFSSSIGSISGFSLLGYHSLE